LGSGGGHTPLACQLWPWWPRPRRACAPPGSPRFHGGFILGLPPEDQAARGPPPPEGARGWPWRAIRDPGPGP
jgi:hypothetical protein